MISYRNVFYILGILFFIFSGLMLIPAVVDLCLQNDTCSCFVISSLFCCFFAGLLFFSSNSDEKILLNIKEKILTVLLAWITIPVLSSIPIVLSSSNISFINCLFEAASALTTTGSTVIYDIKSISDGISIWRAILQFTGGICFIVSCLYVFRDLKYSYTNAFEKSNSSNIIQQIKNLILVYLALITFSSFLLIGSGLSAIDSICYTLSSISSGGSISDNSYNIAEISHRINWILSILMFIGGCSTGFINNLIHEGTSAFNNKQFICYTSIILTLTILLAIHIASTSLIHTDILEDLEKSFLIITSSITTTGLPIASSEIFGNFIDTILYIVNFIGGCSGSCTGGIKIFRIIILYLLIKNYFMRITKTKAIYIPSYGGKRLGEADVTSILSYFVCYAILALIFTIALSFSEMDFGRAFGAVATTMNNNGPFFGLHKATPMQILELSSFTKYILISAMIAGRVEFVLFFMVTIKSFWKKG